MAIKKYSSFSRSSDYQIQLSVTLSTGFLVGMGLASLQGMQLAYSKLHWRGEVVLPATIDYYSSL